MRRLQGEFRIKETLRKRLESQIGEREYWESHMEDNVVGGITSLVEYTTDDTIILNPPIPGTDNKGPYYILELFTV